MSNQKTNPKAEWGFYAMTPRIIRTQYKQLSHTEKWLYVCLKDLCGDKGMCYRTLRVLEEETGLSTGNLSTGIRHLHEAGLVHAEKKRRSNLPKAKEVWHISIVDIWQSNVEYCSKNEHCQEDVQELNNNVQNMNNSPAQCSNSEQQCSNFDDRRITPKNNNIEERTSEEESTDASAIASAARTPFVSQQEMEEIHIADTAPKASVSEQEDVPPDENENHSQNSQILQKTTKRGSKPKEVKPPVAYKADKAAIRDLIVKGRRGQALCEKGEIIQENIAINALAIAYTLEQLQSVHLYLQTRDKFYSQIANKFRIGGVAMAKNAPSVLCILEIEHSGDAGGLSNATGGSSIDRYIEQTYNPSGSFADEFYPSEAEKRAQYAAAD